MRRLAGVRTIFHPSPSIEQQVAAALAGALPRGRPGVSRLTPFTDFSPNPGDLDGWIHVPAELAPGAPLVIVLHGCTQTPASYDQGAAWSVLADECGFIALFPGQKRSNNPNLCFNWFSPRDARRDRGEARSIFEMLRGVQERYATDPKRTFITGLSAGGAMTSVMLAAYPEVFAAGAIIAGLPFGTANNVPQALERMRGIEMPSAAQLEALVRSASSFKGRWPRISVWHGTNDATVSPTNADAIVTQWQRLHSLAEQPSRVEKVGNHSRRVWVDKNGRHAVEEYVVSGMAHGTPLSTLATDSAEVAGPHMLEAGISSTREIARFWGLQAQEARQQSRSGQKYDGPIKVSTARVLRHASRPNANGATSVRHVIEKALRRAGLMS